MKNRIIKPIFIRLQPDYYLLGLLLVVSSAALWVVMVYVSMLWLKVSLILWVLVSSGYYALRDALLRLAASWQTLEVTSLGELIVCNQSGQCFKPQLAASSVVHPYLIVLNFKPMVNTEARVSLSQLFAHKKSLVLLSCDDVEALRQLRIWLRWWPHARLNQAADSVDALENAT